ncbi:MAG: hypothetical protein EOO51_12695 [Flavobacterium sp.]|nr:MAG: hypothetical protein EOO51_12695 [Flavobacterium sp.]
MKNTQVIIVLGFCTGATRKAIVSAMTENGFCVPETSSFASVRFPVKEIDRLPAIEDLVKPSALIQRGRNKYFDKPKNNFKK